MTALTLVAPVKAAPRPWIPFYQWDDDNEEDGGTQISNDYMRP